VASSAKARGQQEQLPEQVVPMTWVMIRLIVRAHRPHCALQPRQP
jgi:hypothetical protein